MTLSGSGTVTLGAQTLTLTDAATTFSGAIDGIGGLTLTTGTETLTGDNLYTGATTINGGTLTLSGSGSIAIQRRCRRRHLRYLGDDLGRLDQDAVGQRRRHAWRETLTLTNASTTFSGTISSTGGGITVAGGALALGTLTLDDLTLAGIFSDLGTLTVDDA